MLLINAHPLTATDGSQILAFQSNPSRPISDITWPFAEVEALLKDINEAVSTVSTILDKTRPTN